MRSQGFRGANQASGPETPPLEPGPASAGTIPWNCGQDTVEIDRDIAREAAAILGTTTLRDTINASMKEVVNSERRLELSPSSVNPAGSTELGYSARNHDDHQALAGRRLAFPVDGRH